MKTQRAKDYALKAVTGDEKGHYGILYECKKEILRTNPGSTMVFKELMGLFTRIYVCLDGLKKAFKAGYRPLICLDSYW